MLRMRDGVPLEALDGDARPARSALVEPHGRDPDWVVLTRRGRLWPTPVSRSQRCASMPANSSGKTLATLAVR